MICVLAVNNRFYGGLMPVSHPGPLSQIEPASFDSKYLLYTLPDQHYLHFARIICYIISFCVDDLNVIKKIHIWFSDLGVRTPPPFFLKPSLADRIDDGEYKQTFQQFDCTVVSDFFVKILKLNVKCRKCMSSLQTAFCIFKINLSFTNNSIDSIENF